MASEKPRDVEAVPEPDVSAKLVDEAPAAEAEYGVSLAKKTAYLAFYFTANVSLTIYNKLVLGKVCTREVPMPFKGLTDIRRSTTPGF
jgi:hypothetical protein